MPVHPISYSIADHLIQTEPTKKTTLFAPYMPGMKYCYDDSEEYLKGYRTAIFGVTSRKNGWDCWRHVEILSQGCFPYMLDLETIPAYTMTRYPKEHMKQWMDRYSRKEMRTIHKYSSSQLNQDIEEALFLTRQSLSAISSAKYILQKFKSSTEIQSNKVLIINNKNDLDYMESSLLYGIKHMLGKSNVHVVNELSSLYKSYTIEQSLKMLGRGMNYTRILDDSMKNYVSHAEIIENIKSREYDSIFYSHIHTNLYYLDIILQYYDLNELIFICPLDCNPLNDPDVGWTTTYSHSCMYSCLYNTEANFFLREYGDTNLNTLSSPIKITKDQFFNTAIHINNVWASNYNQPLWEPTCVR